MSKRDLTAENLREYLSYDPETGLFTWVKSLNPRAPVGRVANCKLPTGYIQVSIFGEQYLAHRLAWFYHYGFWPKYQVDHINGVRDDNRISNLRDVPLHTNRENMRSPIGKNPYLGASRRKDGKWIAQLRANKKTYWLGSYGTPEEAHAAYVEAKRKLHAGCTI